MSRIYPAHAYGNGPRARCFWPDTVTPPDCPAAEGTISCDVAIIGAGFAGLSAALHLAETGQHVRVFKADPPAGAQGGARGAQAPHHHMHLHHGHLRSPHRERAPYGQHSGS